MVRQGIVLTPFSEFDRESLVERAYVAGSIYSADVSNAVRDEVIALIGAAGSGPRLSVLLMNRFAEPELRRCVLYFLRVAKHNPAMVEPLIRLLEEK